MKTPKEKALKLWWKYYHIIEHTLSDEYSKQESFIVKQCALITVNELIKETGAKYWYDVKHELEQL